MDLAWFDGFDGDGDATTLARGYVSTSLAGCVFDGPGRFGGYSIGHEGGGDCRIRTPALTLADATKVVVGFALYASELVDAGTYVALLDSGGTTTLVLEAFSGGATGWDLRARVGDTVLGTTPRFAADTWVWVELYVESSTGTGGVLEIRANGTRLVRVEGVRTSGAGSASVSAVQVALDAVDHCYATDLVVGSGADAVLGDTCVETIWPVSGPRWSSLAGWEGTDPHAELVDDASTRESDDDATYLTTTGAALGSEFFRLSELGRARTHVLAVASTADWRRELAGSHGVLFGRMVEGATTTTAGPVTVTSTSYVRDRVVWGDNGGRPWTREAVEASDWGAITGDGDGLRMTRFALVVAGRAPQVVVPRPLPADLPPFVLPNWASGTQVETSWTTDRTSAYEAIAEDRRGLLSRPLRTITASVLAPDVDRQAALLLGTGRRALDASPGLLVADRARLTASSGVGGTTLYLDTRWRRFFLGQRILVVGDQGEDPEWFLIAGILDDRLTVTVGPTVDHPVGSLVYPCCDAEHLLDAAGDTITAETTDLRLTLVEQPGGAALPPLWVDAAIGWYPVGPDGLPVLDVRPNWREQIRVGLRREAGRDGSGKGSILAPQGTRPRWTLDWSADSLTRESAWRLLRFIESRRGRARAFWAAVPSNLLAYESATSTYVRVRGAGSIEDLRDLVDHVAVHGRDGTLAIGEVSGVAAIGGGTWELTFSDPVTLPSEPYRVSAALRCRLAQDSTVEQWVTDETCSVGMSMTELLDEGVAAISDLTPTSHTFGAPESIPDLHVWFDAQDGPFAFDAMLNGYRRSAAWPHKFHRITEWADRRAALSDHMTSAELPIHRLSQAATGGDVRPYLANFELPWLNSGHRIAMNAGPMRFAPLLNTQLAPRQREFWDNAQGMTLFLAWIGGTQVAAASDKRLIRLTSGGSECFLWVMNDTSFQTRVQLYATPGVVNPAFAITCGSLDEVAMSVAILRWTPGGTCQLYRNGVLQGSIATSPSSFPQVLSYDDVLWFDYFAIAQPPSRGIADDNHFKRPLLNSFLAYRRALTNSECNSVMAYLSASYGIPYSAL